MLRIARITDESGHDMMGEACARWRKVNASIIADEDALGFRAEEKRGLICGGSNESDGVDDPLARRGARPGFSGVARDPKPFGGACVEDARVALILNDGLRAA